MKLILQFFIGISLLGLMFSASAAVNASLDQNHIAQGETLRLTLEYDGQTDTEPDISQLNQDFQIVGQNKNTSIQIINNKMSSQTQLSLVLRPKRAGQLQIPAITWNKQSTPAFNITVDTASQSRQTGNASVNGVQRDIFITTNLDQKQIYVQAAAVLTVKLYFDKPIYEANLEFQANNDVLIQQLGKDQQTSENQRGKSFKVITRKYLLFPQHSGQIHIDGPVLNAQIPDDSSNSDPFSNDQIFGNIFGRNPFAGMLNATKPIQLTGGTILLNVEPRPVSMHGENWLPAKNVSLKEAWLPNQGEIHVGDPVTWHLGLSAEQLTAGQLPDLSKKILLPEGLRAYPDQPKLNNTEQGNSIIGQREQDIAIIASREGRYQIPAIHLYWWDTMHNAQKEIRLPEHTLEILPALSTSANASLKSDNKPEKPVSAGIVKKLPKVVNKPVITLPTHWVWLGCVFAFLSIIILLARLRARAHQLKKLAPNTSLLSVPDLKEARSAFRQACMQHDAKAARYHLLAWAHATWPESPPNGLRALSNKINNFELKPILEQLDRACYTGSVWHGDDLLKLKVLDQKVKVNTFKSPKLDALYPS